MWPFDLNVALKRMWRHRSLGHYCSLDRVRYVRTYVLISNLAGGGSENLMYLPMGQGLISIYL